MLKLTEKSCGLYCSTVDANSMAEMQVMGDSSQFSPLTTLSEQLGPNS